MYRKVAPIVLQAIWSTIIWMYYNFGNCDTIYAETKNSIVLMQKIQRKKKFGRLKRATWGGSWRRLRRRQIKNSGAFGAPNGFKNLTRSMRIPNMCLVLKLDNGKVVSIANEQTESCQHPAPYYNIDAYIHICPHLENFLPAPLTVI